MEVLGKLFGSPARVKIMRLFLFNMTEVFDNADVTSKTKAKPEIIRKEAVMLNKIGFLKKKVFYKTVIRKKGKRAYEAKKRSVGWILDENFPFIGPLHSLLINTELLSSKEIESKLKKTGRLKLVLVSGVFIQEKNSRVDMLIVGDSMKKHLLESAIKLIEAEVGTELSYALLDTDEFKYRMGVYDKLVRDILDYPHQKIINKLGI